MFALAQQVQQQSLRIGDIVLLYSDEGKGYVFSECSRYVYTYVANRVARSDM